MINPEGGTHVKRREGGRSSHNYVNHPSVKRLCLPWNMGSIGSDERIERDNEGSEAEKQKIVAAETRSSSSFLSTDTSDSSSHSCVFKLD